jgi:hypothetical protein
MADTLSFNLVDLDLLDIDRFKVPVRPPPPPKPLPPTQRKILEESADLAARFTDIGNVILQLLALAKSPPAVVLKGPKSIPVGMPGVPPIPITYAIGLNASVFAGVGFTGAVGLYAHGPEFGFYDSFGPGFWLTNLGSSVGGELTFAFGPPSVLGGVSVGVGCNLSLEGSIGVGGTLLFSPPPFRLIGLSASVSTGLSALPLDVTVQVTSTNVRPLMNVKKLMKKVYP